MGTFVSCVIKVIRANQENQEPQREVSITKIYRTYSCDLCPPEVITSLSSQFQLIVEETGFQDHLVHQDLKDFQDHKELKVKLLSNMN